MVCHFLLQRIFPTQVSHIVGSLPSEPPGKSLVQLLSLVRLFATLWVVACHASLSMGFSQARILQWVAISFGEGNGNPLQYSCLENSIKIKSYYYHFQNKDTSINRFLLLLSCQTLCYPIDCSLPCVSVHGIFPGKNIAVG